MAGLYGPLLNRRGTEGDHLPTINELPTTERVPIAKTKVSVLLDELNTLLFLGDSPKLTADSLGELDDVEEFRKRVRSLHIDILDRLEANVPSLANAYSLGRAMCDTCWKPRTADDFEKAFQSERIAQLVAWLHQSQASLPQYAAEAVAISLDGWSAWLKQFGRVPGGWEAAVAIVEQALRHQGELWRSVLSGEQPANSLLSVDGYVQAGERAIRRARQMVVHILTRFWWLNLLILVAVAGLIVVAFRYAGGTAKVWSVIATVAAGLGVSGTSVRAGMRQLVTAAGRPIWSVSEAETIAAALTVIPRFDLGSARRHLLRQQGAVIGAPLITERAKFLGDATTKRRALGLRRADPTFVKKESRPKGALQPKTRAN